MDEKIEQNVFLYSRKRLEITGVCDVCEFSGESVEMELSEGCLGVDGEELRIDYFSADSGKVSIHGNISGIVYYGRGSSSKKKKKGKS